MPEMVIKKLNNQLRQLQRIDEYLLEKRNARERNRVRDLNIAFTKLRLLTPSLARRKKRISKLKILQKVMNYIFELENALQRNG